MRPWRRSDASALATALAESEAHLREFIPWVVDGRVPGQSLEDRLAQHAADFATGAAWVYGLFANESGAILGQCGLYPRVGPGALELGYWVAKHAAGQGIATEASEALVRLAFSVDGIERVEIHCDSRNVASIRVGQRLGFVFERTVPDARNPDVLIEVWTLARR
ncbi:MAG TPA: GNAT family N-acetyltransferase [Gemmatimonadaceae bacterium]|nr:GNAT family N-acetyltransferase [Gemmatimonadaceae bacterium]